MYSVIQNMSHAHSSGQTANQNAEANFLLIEIRSCLTHQKGLRDLNDKQFYVVSLQ